MNFEFNLPIGIAKSTFKVLKNHINPELLGCNFFNGNIHIVFIATSVHYREIILQDYLMGIDFDSPSFGVFIIFTRMAH